MDYSIYHFFADLMKKGELTESNKEMLSCVNDGLFPDLAIKLNQ